MATRDELARLERSARAKVRRLERRGVSIGGSEYDPLKDSQGMSRYQREKYADELRRFTSRNVQFVSDRSGNPMSGYVWNEYKRSENAYKKRSRSLFEQVKDLQLDTGEKISERMEKMRPTHRAMIDPAVNSHYAPVTRSPENVTSEKHVRRLMQSNNNRLRNEQNEYKDAIGQFRQMAEILNDPELSKHAESLSQKQFMTLWRYSSFATAISLVYEQQMKLLAGKQLEASSGISDRSLSRARKMLTHAKGWKI